MWCSKKKSLTVLISKTSHSENKKLSQKFPGGGSVWGEKSSEILPTDVLLHSQQHRRCPLIQTRYTVIILDRVGEFVDILLIYCTDKTLKVKISKLFIIVFLPPVNVQLHVRNMRERESMNVMNLMAKNYIWY